MAGNSLTCGEDLLFIASTTCSGNGVCAENTAGVVTPQDYSAVCVCDDGWTGKGDWVSGDGLDCNVNITILRVLWGITMTFYIVVVLWAIPRVKEVYHRFNANSKGRMRTNSDARVVAREVTENKGYVGVALFLFTVAPATVTWGALEIVGQRVGIDIGPTICFICARTGFFVAGFLFQPFLLNTVIGIRASAELSNLLRHNKINLILLGVEISVGLTSLVAFLNGTQQVQIGTFVAYNLGMSGCMVGLFWQARFLRGEIVESLHRYSEGPSANKEFARLEKRLLRIQTSLMRQTFIQGIVYLSQACIPFVWTNVSYILPVTYFIPGLTFVNLMKALRGTAESKKRKISKAKMPRKWTANPSFTGNDPESNAISTAVDTYFASLDGDVEYSSPTHRRNYTGSVTTSSSIDSNDTRGRRTIGRSSLVNAAATAASVDSPNEQPSMEFDRKGSIPTMTFTVKTVATQPSEDVVPRKESLSDVPLLNGRDHSESVSSQDSNGLGVHPDIVRIRNARFAGHRRSPSFSEVPLISGTRSDADSDSGSYV